MRKIYTIAVALFITASVWAQTPQKMSYQAVVRNSTNQLVADQKVGMRITIVQGSATGTEVYSETQTPATNTNGLVSIEIGGGADFSSIDWSTSSYFIKTEIDPTGGNAYSITGTSQLLSVPYALYAKSSGSSIAGPKGDKGEQGIQGEKGEQGIQGVPGSAILTSSNGTKYELHVDNNGTLYSVLAPGQSLKISDIDGNIYNTISIGSQTWMSENLRVTKYNDGTDIPNITDASIWATLSTGAQCDYTNSITNTGIYGKLYNWYAVNTAKLCPLGWHVPSYNEWLSLSATLGGDVAAGGSLKESGNEHWTSPNTGATNISGFTALPGGNREFNGSFSKIGNYGNWWSSTEYSSAGAVYSGLKYDSPDLFNYNGSYSKASGFSVRCLKD